MSCKSHEEKNETKNIRPLVFSFSPIDFAFWCFLLCFFKRFARFQTLICEPQIIWGKFLVLIWLYQKPTLIETNTAVQHIWFGRHHNMLMLFWHSIKLFWIVCYSATWLIKYVWWQMLPSPFWSVDTHKFISSPSVVRYYLHNGLK